MPLLAKYLKSSIYVRDALPDDWGRGLKESLQALAPVEFEDDFARAKISDARHNAHVRTFVAVERTWDKKETVLGTASLFIEPKFIHGGSFVGHVEDVAVRQDRQLKGVGRILVDHLIGICEEKGCYKVILDCGPHVEHFYTRLGFERHGYEMRLDLR